MDTIISMAESLCCSPEVITLLIGYTSLVILKKEIEVRVGDISISQSQG